MRSNLDLSWKVYGTGEEESWDPQKYVEDFYYSIPLKYRLRLPYEYRDEFETKSPPDYNDQFVFFMLAFFDRKIKKTEREQIDLGFSALLAILEINHAEWISTHAINRIKEELLKILYSKTYDEVIEIFESLLPNSIDRIRLMIFLKITILIDIRKAGEV